jgi:hypothetical protein
MSLGKYVNPKNGSVAYPSDQEDVDILLESGHVKEEEGEVASEPAPKKRKSKADPQPE